jgi:Fe-S-cluster containining protein
VDEWSDEDIDGAVNTFEHAPCPALDEEGLCSVYVYRPLTCRSMGIPMRQEGMTHGACDVQTFVPVRRLSASLQAEEQALANLEAVQLAALSEVPAEGEEVLLPYGFVSGGRCADAHDGTSAESHRR